MKLTVEQWNVLTAEEKELRADEMPQELKGKDDQRLSPEEAQKLRNDIKTLTEQLGNLQHEKSGLYANLKEEQELRRELRDKVKELEDAAGSKGGGDDDPYLTTEKAKKLLADQAKKTDEKVNEVRSEFAKERELTDERRMKTREDLPIPYEDAIKVFAQMAKGNPVYWKQVQDAANTPGGKPAELAYKIAIREHPDFLKKIKDQEREGLISDLEKGGKIKKLPGGGAGGAGKPKVEDMTIEEVMEMSDADWEKAARGK